MRRVWLTAAVCTVVACVPAPPERVELPPLAEVLDPPAVCSFLVGEPLGVAIEEVISGSAADGLLAGGDTIVAVDGQETRESSELQAILSEREVGDVIEVRVDRDGTEETRSITLGSSVDDPTRPLIGVMIRTAYQSIRADEVAQIVAPSITARSIALGEAIYFFDPLVATWERTTISVARDVNWVGTSRSIYSLSTGQPPVLTDLGTGEAVVHDGFGGWDPVRIIGSLDEDLILAMTRPVPGEPSLVTVGISLFDPLTETTVWVTPVLDGFGIPVSATGSPDQRMAVVVGVVEGGSGEISTIDLMDPEGTILGVDGLVALGTPAGWFDEQTILFRTSDTVVSTFSVTDGTTSQLELSPELGGLPLTAVGDGRSALAVSGRGLLLDDLTASGEIRVLAENCTVGRIGEPGWGL